MGNAILQITDHYSSDTSSSAWYVISVHHFGSAVVCTIAQLIWYDVATGLDTPFPSKINTEVSL